MNEPGCSSGMIVYNVVDPSSLGDDLLQLRMLNYQFWVLEHEFYEDQDEPHKPRFRQPWFSWPGVEVEYRFVESGVTIRGSRGKTVWHIPCRSSIDRSALNIEQGLALKITKHHVAPTIQSDYLRIKAEASIQQEFAELGLAPAIFEIVLVRNYAANSVVWFEYEVNHPPGAIYVAVIMEHVETRPMPLREISLTDRYLFEGPIVERIRSICRERGIIPHDIGLGNLFFSDNGWRIVDFHEWRRI